MPSKKNQPKMRRRRNREDSDELNDEDHLEIVEEPAILDVDSLSVIERLPKELALRIIDYAESTAQFRLSSRSLRALVDEHIRAVTNPIICAFEFSKSFSVHAASFTGDVTVCKAYSDLFELRLKLRQPHFNLRQRIKRCESSAAKEQNLKKTPTRIRVPFRVRFFLR
ncbi:hypothetical protein PENTCL1PPCAC_5335 [Pristionchus entomophagus]|uniref:F-box domain-containing protein n=1 Tax=Pristionchus entomophagus TaxID=358040 RepID=A0AAV5SSW6_9BILA|nr:hypothetical protein PENTCL1PPCAC_5335 [Pristionchus entomophagus]